MHEKILIVEDELIVATDLRLILERKGFTVCGVARSYEKAVEIIKNSKPDMVLLDIFLTGNLTGIDIAKKLKEENIAFIYISANANEEILAAAKTTEPYGFIVKPFREKDLLVTIEIARYRHEHSVETKYRRIGALRDQLQTVFASSEQWEQKFLNIATALQTDIPIDYIAAGFNDMKQITFTGCSFLRIGFNEYQKISANELLMITGISMDELVAVNSDGEKEAIATIYNDNAFKDLCKRSSFNKLISDHFQMKSHLIVPFHLPGKEPFNFSFYSKRDDSYTFNHLDLFNHLQYVFTKNLESMMLNEKVLPAAGTPANNITETGKVHPGSCFDQIIGSSHLLLNVFDQVSQVAPMDTSVLILGESGTGKESIASCIHQLSPRKDKPLIKINCATLPSTLIESELFGHEKGSFTGAHEKRTGKFEQANQGTILLDEIGEMSLDLQVKFLRVLQEKEIERIGGKSSIKIDVRIIAATNRNLEKEVAEGRFRLDLYYRLNVFPVTLPPLRQRKEDILALTAHFINYYNRKTGKKITGISDKVKKNLLSYNWPGNIRELQHLIERSILLAKGTIIEEISIPILPKIEAVIGFEEDHTKSINENEREHILSVLKKSNGKISGSGGAAELLKIPPSTLKSKMKKLGIRKDFIE